MCGVSVMPGIQHWIAPALVQMIQNPSPDFLHLDEALLSCSDGHCLFDVNGKLVSWTESFADFYPRLKSKIKPGYSYAEFVRDLIERHGVLKNVKRVDDVDAWLESHLKTIHEKPQIFVHHLVDGRIMSIKHTILSNGFLFFAASDITVSVMQKDALEDNKKKFESFAKLSSDWFWELDSDLRYIYYSKHHKPLGAAGRDDLIGVRRTDHVSEGAVNNLQLREHNRSLEEQKEVDVVMSWRDPSDTVDTRYVQVYATPKYNKYGQFCGYIGCAKNITTEYGLKNRLEYQAAHDELTGLINRRAFGSFLNLSLGNHTGVDEATDSAHKTLIFVDLDQFKIVNDNAGHLAGDQLLMDMTDIFQTVYSHPDDIVARLGGDEFAILSCFDESEAKEKTEDLIRHIGAYRLHWDKRSFSVGASAGIVSLDNTSSDDLDLLSKADIACYSAKMAGRNQVHSYSSDSTFAARQNDEIGKLELINNVLVNKQLSLFLQPIVPTVKDTDELPKFEVLLRLWNDGELVPPAEIIPVAEKYDRMQHLDLWVVEQAMHSIDRFKQSGQPVVLSVNLSGNTLSNESCLDRIARLVQKHEIEPDTLCFEVTETAAIKGIEKACRFIEHLKQMGCQFSLDDFGSGLSSFSYLRSLSVDYLKIDGCFVTNIVEDRSNRAIVTSFNTLAHELGIKTVAEYVENDAIANLLTEMNVDYLQGFGVGKPVCIEEWFEHFAKNQTLTGT